MPNTLNNMLHLRIFLKFITDYMYIYWKNDKVQQMVQGRFTEGYLNLVYLRRKIF